MFPGKGVRKGELTWHPPAMSKQNWLGLPRAVGSRCWKRNAGGFPVASVRARKDAGSGTMLPPLPGAQGPLP